MRLSLVILMFSLNLAADLPFENNGAVKRYLQQDSNPIAGLIGGLAGNGGNGGGSNVGIADLIPGNNPSNNSGPNIELNIDASTTEVDDGDKSNNSKDEPTVIV